jgi:hypothetical protein
MSLSADQKTRLRRAIKSHTIKDMFDDDMLNHYAQSIADCCHSSNTVHTTERVRLFRDHDILDYRETKHDPDDKDSTKFNPADHRILMFTEMAKILCNNDTTNFHAIKHGKPRDPSDLANKMAIQWDSGPKHFIFFARTENLGDMDLTDWYFRITNNSIEPNNDMDSDAETVDGGLGSILKILKNLHNRLSALEEE